MLARAFRSARYRLGKLMEPPPPPEPPPETDYHVIHARQAAEYLPPAGRRVLIVGCGFGEDCRPFVEMGAAHVTGIDLAPHIGRNYQHPRVSYERQDAARMAFDDGSFDLVYSSAVMEHVHDPAGAFREMARVVKPGGIVFSIASPLWNSRNGHHFGQWFDAYPWAHLRTDRAGMIARAGATGNAEAEEDVDYALDPANFNRLPSTYYIAACADLPGLQTLVNRLDLDEEALLTDEIYAELEPKGYRRAELLAVTHRYVGRKPPP